MQFRFEFRRCVRLQAGAFAGAGQMDGLGGMRCAFRTSDFEPAKEGSTSGAGEGARSLWYKIRGISVAYWAVRGGSFQVPQQRLCLVHVLKGTALFSVMLAVSVGTWPPFMRCERVTY